MMDIRDGVKLVLLALIAAGNGLLALFLFARALRAIVSDLLGVKGRATAKGFDRAENVECESGMRGTPGGGRKLRSWMPASVSARPPRELAVTKA